MAKNKRKRSDRQRDPSRVSSDPLDAVDLSPIRAEFYSPLVRKFDRPTPDRAIEDHRTWEPDFRSPRMVSGRKAQVHMPKAKRPVTSSVTGRINNVQSLYFKAPRYVQLCIRRKQRREVLLAKGRGGGNHRPPRRNRFSDIRC